MQTINSVPFSRLLKHSLSPIRVLSESKKKMKIIGLNYLTGHTKKMIYVFRSNGNSFDMVFVTVIQSKIHKSNELLKCRICFHLWLFMWCKIQAFTFRENFILFRETSSYSEKMLLISEKHFHIQSDFFYI